MKYQSEARYIAETTLAKQGRTAGMKHAHGRIKVCEKAGSKMMVEAWQGALHFMKLAEEKAPPKRTKTVKAKTRGVDNWERGPRRPA